MAIISVEPFFIDHSFGNNKLFNLLTVAWLKL